MSSWVRGHLASAVDAECTPRSGACCGVRVHRRLATWLEDQDAGVGCAPRMVTFMSVLEQDVVEYPIGSAGRGAFLRSGAVTRSGVFPTVNWWVTSQDWPVGEYRL